MKTLRITHYANGNTGYALLGEGIQVGTLHGDSTTDIQLDDAVADDFIEHVDDYEILGGQVVKKP